MNRKNTTKKLSEILIDTRLTGMGKHYASEVTIDWGGGKGRQKRVDFMLFEPRNQLSVVGIENGIFTCFEVKSCKEDVYSGNGLNFIGDKNYLVTTMETWESIREDYRNRKLNKHIKECNPEASLQYGIMVATPTIPIKKESIGNESWVEMDKYFTGEYKPPKELSDEWLYKMEIIHPSRIGYRARSIQEMLFYMLRAGR